MERPTQYTSNITGSGSLLPETFEVMSRLASGQSLEEVKLEVINNNLLGKKTEHTRQNTWRDINFRYFNNRDKDFIHQLAKIISSQIAVQAKRLILFFEMAQSDVLIYDMTVDQLFEMYQQGHSLVTKTDIDDWLESSILEHPEIKNWTPQTRKRVISLYLSTVRDCGLLEGRTHKSFIKPYVPLSAFLWVLYRLKEKNLSPKAIVEAEEFKLFYLDQSTVIILMSEASNAGYISFQYVGDIFDIKFHVDTLTEVVDGFTSQVQ